MSYFGTEPDNIDVLLPLLYSKALEGWNPPARDVAVGYRPSALCKLELLVRGCCGSWFKSCLSTVYAMVPDFFRFAAVFESLNCSPGSGQRNSLLTD